MLQKMPATKMVRILPDIVYIVPLTILVTLENGTVSGHRLFLNLLDRPVVGIVPVTATYVGRKAYIEGGSAATPCMGYGMPAIAGQVSPTEPRVTPLIYCLSATPSGKQAKAIAS